MSHASSDLHPHLMRLFSDDGRDPRHRRRLVDLMVLLARLPPPPDPLGLLPRYAELRERFVRAARGDDWETAEESFLVLYAHLHGHDGHYTPVERNRVDETGGYWNHAGGISPIVRAGPWIRPDSVSMDLGAGNGIQLLLLQKLNPHARTIQVEISATMVEMGNVLTDWLGIETDRVIWVVGDVMEADLDGVDFLYMYRPLKPVGEGTRFYEDLARRVSHPDRGLVVFSIADCLRDFAGEQNVFYTDGHLTCFRFPPVSAPGS